MNIDTLRYLDILRPIALALPGITEGTSYGTPSFNVNKKFIARIREDGITLVILKVLFLEAWKKLAPKKLLKEYEQNK